MFNRWFNAFCVIPLVFASALQSVAWADFFYPIQGIEIIVPRAISQFRAENLIQGPGFGFNDLPPHQKLLSGESGDWVTEPCDFGCDFVSRVGRPVIYLDLGKDRSLSEISLWSYGVPNGDTIKDFSLRFASNFDGPRGYGSSIRYSPTFADLSMDPSLRQSLPLARTVQARYVELTVLDNFYTPPFNGVQELPGGNRVGLGEVAFRSPADPCIEDGNCVPVTDVSDYYRIKGIQSSTANTDLWPASNLIQGPGVGFEASAPHRKLLTNERGNWATLSACGSGCDYFKVADPPRLLIDLGEDRLLDSIDLWGYMNGNANGVSQFELRFATAADGPLQLGRSTSYQPLFSSLVLDETPRQAIAFSRPVRARYVELIATDNFGGRPGAPDGGDRLGLGEIAFRKADPQWGDFDKSGTLNVGDVNLLTRAIETQQNPFEFDLDNQGTVNELDLDILIKDVFYSWYGDVNLDRVFDSDDLISVFSSSGARYNQEADAGWADGDWNGDRRFGSGDLIRAFQDGGYNRGLRSDLRAPAVPEGQLAPFAPWALTIFLGLVRRRSGY